MQVVLFCLQDGDIINIDVTVYLDGYHGDNADNFFVGECISTVPSLYLKVE